MRRRRLLRVLRRLLRVERYRVVLTHRYASGPVHTPGWPTSRARALRQFAETIARVACGPDGRCRVRVLPLSECQRLGIR